VSEAGIHMHVPTSNNRVSEDAKG